MSPVEQAVRRLDRFQQSHRSTAFAFGVIKKFGDDRGTALSALIAYYSFLAIFPLLLLVVTVLGFVVHNNPHLQHQLVHSAVAEFPIIGDQIAKNVHSLRATGLGLAVGLAGLVWGGLGFTQAAQHAMAEIWNVPGVERPNFATRIARGIATITLIGVGALATTVLSGVGSFGTNPNLVQTATTAGSVALNAVLFVAAFRVLTPTRIPTANLVPGALCAAAAWTILGLIGGYLVGHQLRHTSQIYGLFAIVLGLISWLYLGAQLTLYGAEVNVVRTRRLYPRSIIQPPLTDSDRRALRDIAKREERRPEQHVHVNFTDAPDTGSGRHQDD